MSEDYDIGAVSDGWARYECRIETRTKRGTQQWRYVIERTFVRTDRYWRTGWWGSNRDKVLRRAVKKMRGLDHSVKDENVEGYL